MNKYYAATVTCRTLNSIVTFFVVNRSKTLLQHQLNRIVKNTNVFISYNIHKNKYTKQEAYSLKIYSASLNLNKEKY